MVAGLTNTMATSGRARPRVKMVDSNGILSRSRALFMIDRGSTFAC